MLLLYCLCVLCCCVLFEPFKVVGVVVVWCAGNNKVVVCSGVVGVVCRVVVVLWIVWYLVGWVVDRVEGLGNEKTIVRALP